mmetsp:Transcript_3241/g.7577  ORF Transcript_3241/g.7577 Transcript_3241/m.7577 type:complete len:300 (-) Transcript_3241:471-1370(-)
MLSSNSLAGILGLIFGPPILIFFSVMALKVYLRISSDEEAMNEVRSTMQARRSRQILGLEGGSQSLNTADDIIDIQDLRNVQTRQTREERIQDCINSFTVPDNSSAFVRFATSDNDPISEMEASSQFGSSQLAVPTNGNTATTANTNNNNSDPRSPKGPPSVRSAQTARSVPSLGGKSVKSSKSQKSTKSFKSSKSFKSFKSSKSQKSTRSSSASHRVSMTRRSIDSFVALIKPSRSKRGSKVGDVCMVCMDGYRHGDVVCKTRCAHVFHKECVEEWMKKHNRCPLCRNDLFRGPVPGR